MARHLPRHLRARRSSRASWRATTARLRWRRAAEAATTRDEADFLVAERDGAIVGYLHFGEGSRGPELFRVYADPAHYGTGVGSALLAELHRRIEGRVDAYVLDVHSRNERGRAFYDRNGFVTVGGGATEDCDLTLRRTLRPGGDPPHGSTEG